MYEFSDVGLALARCRSFLFPVIILIAGNISAGEISVERMVNEVLEHSNLLKMAGDDLAAADAVRRQADAALFPSLDMDAGIAHYEGLKENNFPNFPHPRHS